MSQSYDLACTQCRVIVSIGEEEGERRGDPHMRLFRTEGDRAFIVAAEFMRRHVGHKLICISDCAADSDGVSDYPELDPETLEPVP